MSCTLLAMFTEFCIQFKQTQLIAICRFFLSFAGIKCPVCSKFVLPDDIECHLVMCLTKPRLSYNGNSFWISEHLSICTIKHTFFSIPFYKISEDVLTDAKGECVICLEDLNAGDVIARLPCLCIYHKGWVNEANIAFDHGHYILPSTHHTWPFQILIWIIHAQHIIIICVRMAHDSNIIAIDSIQPKYCTLNRRTSLN